MRLPAAYSADNVPGETIVVLDRLHRALYGWGHVRDGRTGPLLACCDSPQSVQKSVDGIAKQVGHLLSPPGRAGHATAYARGQGIRDPLDNGFGKGRKAAIAVIAAMCGCGRSGARSKERRSSRQGSHGKYSSHDNKIGLLVGSAQSL